VDYSEIQVRPAYEPRMESYAAACVIKPCDNSSGIGFYEITGKYNC
jgi:hypothetical protein